MKKIIPLFIIALLSFSFIMQKEDPDKVRKTPKLNYEIPLGTVWLRDNLFMDKTEIRNLDYLEFLYWTNRMEPEKYKALLPDSLAWRAIDNTTEPYVLYYMRHPTFRNYPVVGVSYEQAVAFSKWRTDRVNQFLYIRDHYKNKEVKWDTVTHFTERVRYSLPTKEIWEYAANAGLDYSYYPMGYEKITDKNNVFVSNTLEYFNTMKYSAQPVTMIMPKECFGPTPTTMMPVCDYTTVVNFGQPNKYGIYNLLGNVSEILADTTFKGLNYENDLNGNTFRLKKKDYPLVDSTSNRYDYKYTFRYQQPKAWLGFRCVCEVLK